MLQNGAAAHLASSFAALRPDVEFHVALQRIRGRGYRDEAGSRPAGTVAPTRVSDFTSKTAPAPLNMTQCTSVVRHHHTAFNDKKECFTMTLKHAIEQAIDGLRAKTAARCNPTYTCRGYNDRAGRRQGQRMFIVDTDHHPLTHASRRNARIAAREGQRRRQAEKEARDDEFTERRRTMPKPIDPIAVISLSRREELGRAARHAADAEAWKKLEERWAQQPEQPQKKIHRSGRRRGRDPLRAPTALW
jgi:hypothetical protein